MMKKFLATTAALSAIGIGAASAQEAKLQSVAEITVIATRTAKNVDEVPNIVSVITDEQIEDQLQHCGQQDF